MIFLNKLTNKSLNNFRQVLKHLLTRIGKSREKIQTQILKLFQICQIFGNITELHLKN